MPSKFPIFFIVGWVAGIYWAVLVGMVVGTMALRIQEFHCQRTIQSTLRPHVFLFLG